MTQLTSTGLVVSRLDERIAELTADFQAIFGNDIVLDPNSPDGQLLGVFAESLNNLDQLLEQVYGMLDPNSATGSVLARLVQLNGIKALGGTASTVVLTLGGQMGAVVNAGSLFHSTVTNTIFSTDATVTIPASGTIMATATATIQGALAAPAGSVTAIDTPRFGLQSATNAADAILGRNPETDGQLRLRRAQSTAYPSQTIREGIQAGLANLSGVSQARVYENDKPIVDPATGQAANSIYAVVLGGSNQDIWNTIYLKKTGGIPTLGAQLGNGYDSLGNPHPISFDRPTATNIYVVINVSQRSGFPADGATQMKNALIAWAATNYNIGQEVIQSDMYEPLAAIPSKSITSLFIGTAPSPTTSTPIATAYNALATFLFANIVVNVT